MPAPVHRMGLVRPWSAAAYTSQRRKIEPRKWVDGRIVSADADAVNEYEVDVFLCDDAC